MNDTLGSSRSIIRRSATVLAFTIPGLLLNLLLIYLAAGQLDAEDFGVFYVSISIANILVAPSLMLSMFYSRHFVAVAVSDGWAGAVAAFQLCTRRILRWGLCLCLVMLIVLIGFGFLTGVTSFTVIVLIVLISYGAYFGDSMRAVLQSLQSFTALGAFGFVWMALRFIFGGGAILTFGTVTAGLFGLFLAGLVVFIVGYWLLTRDPRSLARIKFVEDPSLKTVPAFFLSYGFFIIIVYLDVLLAYLTLDHIALSAYSASAVLPKGIVVATVPVVQVFFTTFLFSKGEVVSLKSAILFKSFALTTLLSGGAIALLILLPEPFCGGRYGISFCQTDAMAMIALSTLPLCVLRVLVLTQLARGQEWHPLLLALPTAAFIIYSMTQTSDVAKLSVEFAMFSYGLLLFYILLAMPIAVVRRFATGSK